MSEVYSHADAESQDEKGQPVKTIADMPEPK